MSRNRKTYTPRNLQTYTSEQLEIIDERETSNSNWDLNWSNIGLNWIDLDERAAHIYSIYMRILDKYINILDLYLIKMLNRVFLLYRNYKLIPLEFVKSIDISHSPIPHIKLAERRLALRPSPRSRRSRAAQAALD